MTTDAALFVGRTKEIARIKRELAAGRNLVVTGRFGIGRTTLAVQVARELGSAWRFVFLDGSQTSARVCEHLLHAWAPQQRAQARSADSWTVTRSRLGVLRSPDARPVALVLDDIAKVTRPKLDFVRRIARAGHLRIIAVTELFLPDDELFRLRSVLCPAPLIRLGPLASNAALEFFSMWSRQHGLGWDAGHIQGLAAATHGYPLGMWEAARLADPVGTDQRKRCP